jgi:hypothetical protein
MTEQQSTHMHEAQQMTPVLYVPQPAPWFRGMWLFRALDSLPAPVAGGGRSPESLVCIVI